MATSSLLSVMGPEQNGSIKHHHENGGDHDVVLSTLMQKLKMTSKQIKAWSQTSHKLRLAMSKYTEPDPVDPTRLQKCMEKLKMAIKVSSLPAMNERLDAIARQVGLKASRIIERPDVFLSSDCFYVEVQLAQNGSVRDVVLVHSMTGTPPQTCPEMCEALKKNDFKEFTEHLKGLCQMYQLGGDSKMKATAFTCLQALEMDLKTLFQFGSVKFISPQEQGNPLLHITKGLVGYVTPRVGGYPMRLTYFVSPYDLLDVEKRQTTELTTKEPLPKDLGLSVTVVMETAPQRKIQTNPIIMVTDNKITNILQLSNQNSVNILATFVLKLSQPMPMSISLMKQLQNVPGVSTQYADLPTPMSLNSLICRFTLDPVGLKNPQRDGRQGRSNNFNVELPDQHHSYIINDGSNASDMQGALLSKILFTSPNNVIKIISLLRQQAVYNTLIASCVRNTENEDSPEANLFEVTPYTHQKLTVTFEHPAKEGVACVEFDLTDHSSAKAKIHGCGSSEEPFCTDEYATKVLQKSLSIPVTMRAIMKRAEQWLETHQPKKPVSLSPAPSSGPSGGSVFDPISGLHRHSGLGGGHGGSFFTGHHRPHQSSSHQLHHSHSILSDLTTTMSAILPHGEGFDLLHGDKPNKVVQNPMLASLLQHVSGNSGAIAIPPPPPSPSSLASPPPASGPKPHKNPMLMTLLQEQPVTPIAVMAQPVGQIGRMPGRRKRVRSISVDKSPKRQQSEEDHEFEDFHTGRPHPPQHRLSDTHKMAGHLMEGPRPMVHSGELSALLSEIEPSIIPVTKPKKGRPCRLDSTSSQSSVGARQSPKTPSTPTIPTTPTFMAPPKAMSHSTLSTPEHPSMDEFPVGMKNSDIFSHNSKSLFTEDLLSEGPKSNMSAEAGRRGNIRSQYSLDSLDINDDLLKGDGGFDNDDEFGGLPSVNSAIARMVNPQGSDFDEEHRTTTDLPPPVSLSALTSGPLPTAIQAGLETRLSTGALDLSVPNISKSMSIPDLSLSQRGRPPGSGMQGVTNLSQSLPASHRRVPVSKGKPKNFIESGHALQAETRKVSKKKRKGLKDTGGFSDSDAPRLKKRGRRVRREKSSSESSPEPCLEGGEEYSSITMAVNKEQPLKMTFKTIRHKPEKEQKGKAVVKESGPAPKIKIRAMTSGESTTPSPNPHVRETKVEEKSELKTEPKAEVKVEMPEKSEAPMRPIKVASPVVKSEMPKEVKGIKEEATLKVPREMTVPTQRVEEQPIRSMSEVSLKGSHDAPTAVKLEQPPAKMSGITKTSPLTHIPKVKNDFIKKSRSLDNPHRSSPVPKSPIADFFQAKKSIASLPRIPRIKQPAEGRPSPGLKTPTTPKPVNVSSPAAKSPSITPAKSPLMTSAKSPLMTSPKKSVWGKGDSPKVGTAKKLLTPQRMGSVGSVGRKPEGMKLGLGKAYASGSKSPVMGQGIRKSGPNILSKSVSSPVSSPTTAKANPMYPVGINNKTVQSPSAGTAKPAGSHAKTVGSASPVPRIPTGTQPKSQTSFVGVKSHPTPTSSAPSKVPGGQAISLVAASKNSSVTTTPTTLTQTPPTSSSSSSGAGATVSTVTKPTLTSSTATVPSSAPPAVVRSISTTSPSVTQPLSSGSTTVASSVTTTNTKAAMTAVSSLPSTVTTTPPAESVPVSSAPHTVPSKMVTPTSTKTATGNANRPPPLIIPTNVTPSNPSITSPTTPLSASTPTSAGKMSLSKLGMRGGKKSLISIIDKIKEKNEKVDKVDKVVDVKSDKNEKVERVGLFSALGSGTSGLGDGSEEKEKADVELEKKDSSAPDVSNVEKSESLKDSRSSSSAKPEEAPSKDAKTTDTVIPTTKVDSVKPQTSKVPTAGGQPHQTLQTAISKSSGLTPSPSTQSPGVVKSKSSPKHPSQSRPPKVSTPPLTGTQKRASSPTGKGPSTKQSKPSPLSTTSTPSSTTVTSPIKPLARPGSSPMQRTRPIILSHSLSTYQSPEKGQQKVTKVQLAMQPELLQQSLLAGQSSTSPSLSKTQSAPSQNRSPSPSVKPPTVTTSKASDPSRKLTTPTPKGTTDGKSEPKQTTSVKTGKPDQSVVKSKMSGSGKDPSSHSQQNPQRVETKMPSEAGVSRVALPSKKSESKPSDPRGRKDSVGLGKDRDGGDGLKSSKPPVMRTISKEAKAPSNSNNQDGKSVGKNEQKAVFDMGQKPKVTPIFSKSISQGEKEKSKNDEVKKPDIKSSVPEIKGAEKREAPEESGATSSSKPPALDFKVPSPAMVPSPKNPALPVASPKPTIKPASSPKPILAYSPKAPSPQSAPATGAVPSPGGGAGGGGGVGGAITTSPKPTAPKRSATPVNTSPQPAKKARTLVNPYSPMESDDDLSMVIDVPQSPKNAALQQQKQQQQQSQQLQRSPRPDSRNSNTQTEAGSTSPRSAVAHSPLGQIAQSPLGIGKSPASVKSIGSDSISRSPCRIDDDLMDEALTTSIQNEDV